MITCQICQSQDIKFYRQKIAGGRVYVTARCRNGHSPIKGRPFYPVEKFVLDELPFLITPGDEIKTQQQNFFDNPPEKIVKDIFFDEKPFKYPRQTKKPPSGINVPIEVNE